MSLKNIDFNVFAISFSPLSNLDLSTFRTFSSNPLWNAGMSQPTKYLVLSHLQRSGLDIAKHPLRPDMLLLTGILYLKWSCFSVSVMYWSSNGVLIFSLPNRALDITNPVSSKPFKVPCSAPWETFGPATIWRLKSLPLLRITISDFWHNHLALMPCFPLSQWYLASSVLLETWGTGNRWTRRQGDLLQQASVLSSDWSNTAKNLL